MRVFLVGLNKSPTCSAVWQRLCGSGSIPGHHCFRSRASTTTNPPPFRRRLAAFFLLLLLVSLHRPSWNLGLGSCFGAIHRLSWADPWMIKFVHCQCPFLPYTSTSDIGAKAREKAADGLPAARSPDQQRPGARRAAFRGSPWDSYKQTSVRRTKQWSDPDVSDPCLMGIYKYICFKTLKKRLIVK